MRGRARAHAAAKVAICARHGIAGLPPLNEDLESLAALPEHEAWQAIFRKDLEMMERSDLVIANLTPFRGASADAGTLVELGWFLGRGRPAFGYSNGALPFAERSRRQVAAVPDPLIDQCSLVGPPARIKGRLAAWKDLARENKVGSLLLAGATKESARVVAEAVL